MNKAFRLSLFGVLVCAGVTVLSSQKPEARQLTASPSLLTLGLLVDNSGSLRSHFQVYAIGFPQALGRQDVKKQERARKYLSRLADKSGERVYFPATKTDIENVANSVLNDIRNQ